MALIKLLPLLSLALAVSAGVVRRQEVSPPSSGNLPNTEVHRPEDSTIDVGAIQQLAATIDQATGPTGDSIPSETVPETVITAQDGELTTAGQSGDALLAVLESSETPPEVATGSSVARRSLERRSLERRKYYQMAFDGTGIGPNDRDASLFGTAYLTFKFVNDDNGYNIDDCLAFCDEVTPCQFANLYYEYNIENPGSNLKCALYGEQQVAADKRNFGGQQLLPPPAGVTYVQHSTGWGVTTPPPEPSVPEGYSKVFGPTQGINSAAGFLGSINLNLYDVQACANLCNAHAEDEAFGLCEYFNIASAVSGNKVTTYVCNLFGTATTESTLVSPEGFIFSRAYKRIDYLVDGGFEESCSGSFCFTEEIAHWIATGAGNFDASFFHFGPYAWVGEGSALLGSASGVDNLPGTITSKHPLATVPGYQYVISWFAATSFSGPTLEAPSYYEVRWNGATVLAVSPGFQQYNHNYITVTATGNDVLSFYGGSAPAWVFLDDVHVYLNN